MTGSTNNSSTSLHTMSPLNSSGQNLAASSSNAIIGSPLRRVPPALPGLPSRPVAPRSTRSGSKSAVPTLDKVDEKVKPPLSMLNTQKQIANAGSPREESHREESSLPSGSGVARLIAEANRRAQAIGTDASAKSGTIASSASTSDGEVAQNHSPVLTRSIPTLPARTSSAPAREPLNSSVLDVSALSAKGPPALPPPLRRDSCHSGPPRKGSLNASMRGSQPSGQTVPATDQARSASTDGSKPRRLPPPVLSHGAMKELAARDAQGVVPHPDKGSLGAKKPKPPVPAKPSNLL